MTRRIVYQLCFSLKVVKKTHLSLSNSLMVWKKVFLTCFFLLLEKADSSPCHHHSQGSGLHIHKDLNYEVSSFQTQNPEKIVLIPITLLPSMCYGELSFWYDYVCLSHFVACFVIA